MALFYGWSSTALRLEPLRGGSLDLSQPSFTCSKLTIETLEQGAKYVQR